MDLISRSGKSTFYMAMNWPQVQETSSGCSFLGAKCWPGLLGLARCLWKLCITSSRLTQGYRCDSVVEPLPTMHRALDSISSATKK